MLLTMPHQDQQLINNLLQQQNTSAYAQQLASESRESSISVARVVTAKYKVYVIALLIFGMLLGLKVLPQSWQKLQLTQQSFAQQQQELTLLEEKIQDLNNQKKTRKLIDKAQQQIMQCINQDEQCDSLQQKVGQDWNTALAYLQLGSLSSEKMGVDEKKILKNLDQYLIKNDPDATHSSRNGDIQQIDIGEEKLLDAETKFYQLPIMVTVAFDDKDDLISFVDNIEKYIIPEPQDRILYSVQELSYDMMAYDERQETEIWMLAYYFK